MEIIAHRGASDEAPENTIAAFELGWEQRADAAELDIHLTKDGEIVVMHDANTKRTAYSDQPITAQTLAELRALEAGAWKGEQWAGMLIPTLSEALATIPDGKRLFIEIKCGPEVLPELQRVLRASGKRPEQLVLIGFQIETVTMAKKRFPQLPVFWLVAPAQVSEGLSPTVDEMIQCAVAANLDGLDLQFEFPFNVHFVRKIKAAGLEVFAWTVDDPVIAQKLVQAGVNGITTNRPGWLREQLN